MADTITLEVARYSPEKDSEPGLQSYEVPCREDWVVLDALNYVKDQLDGSLTYRWSCRMGVCGSCGMMVDGQPKLTCAVPLADYAPGPVRIEPLQFFPVMRDLVVDITDFLEKLRNVQPWIVRDEEKPIADGEYLQTPAQLEAYKQFSMCINCMLCYAACPGRRSGGRVHGTGGDRPRATLQSGFAGPGRGAANGGARRARRHVGGAPSSASARRFARRTSIPPGRFNSTRWPARRTGSSPCCCHGVRSE